MVSSGVDSNVNVHPILVDADGRPYVNLYNPASVATADTIVTHPDGLGIFGRQHVNQQWTPMPIALYTSTDLNKGVWVVPITPMTRERMEGVKITDGTDTVTLAHGVAIPVCTQHHLTTLNVDFAGAQADGIVLSPGATESIHLESVYVSTNDKLTDLEINEETSDDLLFKLYTTNQQTTSSANLNIEMVAGKDLLITCGAGTFVQICYVLE